jgi:hypothetical protein
VQNQKLPERIAAAKIERKRKGIKPCKRWRDEVEVDLNKMGGKKRGRQWPQTVGNRGRLCWEKRSVVLEGGGGRGGEVRHKSSAFKST